MAEQQGQSAQLSRIVEAELRQPVSDAVVAVAQEIRRRHGEAVLGCLFYGSCLRDGQDDGRVLDFYTLVDSYRAFHRGRVMAFLNKLIPPNVYYLEMPFEGRTLRAKYAVVSMAALFRDSSPAALVPTIWARMAQPCALPYARDEGVRDAVRDALVQAVRTTAGQTLPLLPARFSASDLWTRAFRESYRTEFRAERVGRSEVLHGAAVERYANLTEAALAGEARPVEVEGDCESIDERRAALFEHAADPGRRRAAERRWYWRRQAGRCLHVLRLIKNAHTFTDGLDYVLWKIETHSGIRTEPTAWQRRHPLLAAPGLAWRLYRKGAFR